MLKTPEKSSSTSFWVWAAPKSWSKYTTNSYCCALPVDSAVLIAEIPVTRRKYTIIEMMVSVLYPDSHHVQKASALTVTLAGPGIFSH